MKDWNEITPFRILIVVLVITLLIAFLPSCTIYESTTTTPKHSCELMDRGQACLSDHSCCKDDSYEVSYWRTNYATTVGLYYYNDIPYWGYYSGHYYYYGSRHIYPWWYYYNSIPPYYYGATTHVHCHIGNSGYVYRPRGNWRHNNKTHLTYHHDKVHTTGINVKGYSNVPTKWKNNVKTNIRTNTNKVNTNRTNTKVTVIPIKKTNVKTNTNYTRPKNNTKVKTNRTNIKVNTNKSNTNRSNKNRSNTKSNRKPR